VGATIVAEVVVAEATTAVLMIGVTTVEAIVAVDMIEEVNIVVVAEAVAGMVVVVAPTEGVIAVVGAVLTSAMIAKMIDALRDDEMTAELHLEAAVEKNHCGGEGRVAVAAVVVAVAMLQNQRLVKIAAKDHQLADAVELLRPLLLARAETPKSHPRRARDVTDLTLESQVCHRETRPLGLQRERFRRLSEG